MCESEESPSGSRRRPDVDREFRLPAGWPQGLALAALIFLATLATFARSGQNAFVEYDDNAYVTANRIVQQGLTPQGVAWAFLTSHVGNWHAVTWLSHMLDCELWGLEPAGHHGTSVVLHALNAVLLFGWLVRATCARCSPRSCRSSCSPHSPARRRSGRRAPASRRTFRSASASARR